MIRYSSHCLVLLQQGHEDAFKVFYKYRNESIKNRLETHLNPTSWTLSKNLKASLISILDPFKAKYASSPAQEKLYW